MYRENEFYVFFIYSFGAFALLIIFVWPPFVRLLRFLANIGNHWKQICPRFTSCFPCCSLDYFSYLANVTCDCEYIVLHNLSLNNNPSKVRYIITC